MRAKKINIKNRKHKRNQIVMVMVASGHKLIRRRRAAIYICLYENSWFCYINRGVPIPRYPIGKMCTVVERTNAARSLALCNFNIKITVAATKKNRYNCRCCCAAAATAMLTRCCYCWYAAATVNRRRWCSLSEELNTERT